MRHLIPAFIALLVGAIAGFIGRSTAEAIDVDMKPAACYVHLGESAVDSKHGFAAWGLVFDACRRDYKWVKVPAQPDSEA